MVDMIPRRNITPKPTLTTELSYLDQGYQIIAGADEAGRGSIFGPVCVGIVALPLQGDTEALQNTLDQVRDSKKLARPKVYRLSDEVKQVALAWGVGASAAQEVDTLGIVRAIGQAAQRAWQDSQIRFPHIQIDFLLTDSVMPVEHFIEKHAGITKGDLYCLSIACAAILAKRYHDELVRTLAEEHHYHPDYQLQENVGYGTEAHRLAVKKYGRTPHHRTSYKLKILDEA